MTSFLLRKDTPGDSAWAGFKLWYYTPSIAAAVIFATLFVGLTSYHVFLVVRRRTWFCIPFVVGGFLEIIGYISRALASNNKESTGIYTSQALCLLLAPILFAASVYMILGRIVRVVQGEDYCWIRVNWLTKIFVGGDIFCFMMQGAGGGLLSTAKTADAVNMANNVILGGLIFQILVFILFLVTAVLFQVRLQRTPTTASLNGALGGNNAGSGGRLGRLTWNKLMLGLYATSVLITVRNLFRAIEYGMGWQSYLLQHEWSLYLFDGLLMVLVLVVCIMWYNPEISKGKKGAAPYEAHRLEIGENVGGTQEIHRNKVDTNRSHPWS